MRIKTCKKEKTYLSTIYLYDELVNANMIHISNDWLEEEKLLILENIEKSNIFFSFFLSIRLEICIIQYIPSQIKN
jgi:hypothetical protein